MPDVQNATVWTVPTEDENEPDRQYVLTIDVDPATGKPVVGARDVTYDEDYQSSINTVDDSDLKSSVSDSSEPEPSVVPGAIPGSASESQTITNPEGNG